ncbi:MAG: PEP-CTERM sorting domain-containing protein [Armatimonadetes bacterium]|nr:PEP-CTERM sorting domain-containing protein [Armatimonadota bacterium]
MNNFTARSLGVIGFIAGAQCAFSQISQVSLDQLDWFGPDGSLAAGNSTWGQISLDYSATSTPQYLNLFLSSGSGSPVLAIQNMPLIQEIELGNQISESVNFDLGTLGFTTGQDVSNLSMGYSLTPGPVNAIAPTMNPIGVGSRDRRAWDQVGESTGVFAGIGTSIGLVGGFTNGILELLKARKMDSVQEADNHCFAGATARSLGWLNRQGNFNHNRTSQQIYDDLVTAGVSQPNADGTKAREKWIKKKNDYARGMSGNSIATSSWDAGGNLDPVPGVPEAGGDFKTWLKAQFAQKKDIEIVYNFAGGGHIVTLVGLYEQNGECIALYADDEDQGNPNMGDGLMGSKIKRTKIIKDGNTYRWGSNANTITWALSEAVPEPSSLAAILVAGVMFARRRK